MSTPITPDTLIANSGGAADQSVQVLSYVFGTPIPGIGGVAGPGSAVFSSFFLIFNTALFALGVSWFAWSVMSATVHTATDGEFLGKRYSTFWFTIRGVLGFAGLVPVAQGWSLAQVFMYGTAIMGIGLANLLTGGQTGLMSTLAGNSLTPNNWAIQHMSDASVPPGPEALSLARNMLRSQLCVEGVNRSRDNIAESTQTELSTPRLACGQSQVANGANIIEYRCGYPSTQTLAGMDASCGGFDLKIPSTTPGGIDPAQIALARVAALKDLETKMQALARATVDAVDKNVTFDYKTEVWDYSWDEMIPNPDGPAEFIHHPSYRPETFVSAHVSPKGSTPTDIEARVVLAAKEYEQATATAAQSQLVAAVPAIRQTLNQAGGPANGGWVTFGTAFNTYSSQLYQLGDAINAKVEPIPAESPDEFGTPGFYDKASLLVTGQQQQTGDAASGGNAVFKYFASLPVGFMKLLASNGPNSSTDAIVNPVVYSKELGDDILSATEGAVMAYIVGRGAVAALDEGQKSAFDSGIGAAANLLTGGAAKSFISGAMAAIKEMLVAASPMITLLAIALVIFGATLSIYIPMIPFITWWGGVIQWFVVVVESVVAASLWAFAHLDADGEGLGQRTQYGYIFVLNLLLRPALMVISFIAATLAVMVLGTLLLKLMALAIPEVQTNSMTGVVSFVGFLMIFISLTLALVHTCFGMTGLITDQVLNWIGGHVGHAFGRDQDERSKQVFVAGMSKAEGAASRIVGGGGAKKANPLVEKDDD